MHEPVIRTFDNIEEALEAMRTATDQANSTLHPIQRAVTYGDYWVRFFDLENRILIWGFIEPMESVLADEAALAEDGDDGPSQQEVREHVQGNHDRGYMYGKAYSVIEPEGEWGDTHRAHMWPISEELFMAAKGVDWRMDDLDYLARQGLEQAYEGWRAHQLTLVPADRQEG